MSHYSPLDPSSLNAAPSTTARNLILIDNYDSFTWNLYQYLSLEGATVTVYRNDQIEMTELIAANPTQLVISPGPGHPETDSGISREAIRYFAGKVPVLGVCMGAQCIYSVFGGIVEAAPEILHGKTSCVEHYGVGLYQDVSDEFVAARYHSLAGNGQTMPDCLKVTSWVKDTHLIMGVRHGTYTVEGVQFHPESVLTPEGRLILRNFLRIQGGTWPVRHNDMRLSGQIGSSYPVSATMNCDLEAVASSIKALQALQAKLGRIGNRLGSPISFTLARYMSFVLDSARAMNDKTGLDHAVYRLRHVSCPVSTRIHSINEDLQTSFLFHEENGGSSWHNFTVHSSGPLSTRDEYCRGMISVGSGVAEMYEFHEKMQVDALQEKAGTCVSAGLVFDAIEKDMQNFKSENGLLDCIVLDRLIRMSTIAAFKAQGKDLSVSPSLLNVVWVGGFATVGRLFLPLTEREIQIVAKAHILGTQQIELSLSAAFQQSHGVTSFVQLHGAKLAIGNDQ